MVLNVTTAVKISVVVAKWQSVIALEEISEVADVGSNGHRNSSCGNIDCICTFVHLFVLRGEDGDKNQYTRKTAGQKH